MKEVLSKRIFIVVFLALYAAFSFSTYKDYGLTLDEFFVYTRGQYFYTYVRGNDPTLNIAFKEKGENNRNLLFKNSSYPGFLYIFNDAGVTGEGGYEQYHLLNLLFASVAFWALYEFLLAVKVKPSLAILGPILLFFTPRFLGHLPANPKDMPYAVTYFVTLLFMFLNRKFHPILRIFFIGGAIGVTASLRQVGFILLPLYGLYRMYEMKIWHMKHKAKVIFWELVEVFLMFVVSFCVILFTFPYIQADPINRFIELLEINRQFPWNERVLLFDKEYYPDERPWTYLFIWFGITTPLLLLALFFASLKSFWEDKLKVLIIGSLAINLLLYIVLRPVVYDGLRHFLFFLPQIVLLGTLALQALLKNRQWRKPLLILLVVHVLLIGYHYITLHPYEYAYFNEFVGSLKGASTGFERDYWGASDKEAMSWLNNYLATEGIENARIATCSRSSSIEYYLPNHIDANNDIDSAEYFVCYDRFNSLEEINGEVIHTVQRQGVTLNSIVRVAQ